MSKKYVPSGYQIINLDVSDKTSGIPFTPETEDEKILHEILSSGKLSKPILLHIITGAPYEITGFAVKTDNSISLTFGNVGSSITEELSISSDKLVWIEYEE